jgi:hypothetical protein
MKLTDTQLVLLSAASQHEDGGVEIGPNLKGSASRKVLGKLAAGVRPGVGASPTTRRGQAAPAHRRPRGEAAAAICASGVPSKVQAEHRGVPRQAKLGKGRGIANAVPLLHHVFPRPGPALPAAPFAFPAALISVSNGRFEISAFEQCEHLHKEAGLVRVAGQARKPKTAMVLPWNLVGEHDGRGRRIAARPGAVAFWNLDIRCRAYAGDQVGAAFLLGSVPMYLRGVIDHECSRHGSRTRSLTEK